ncbi:MAG: hypothetical protein ACOX34_04450 [Bacillota bacterium]|jgi:hypothetical protein
MFKRTIPVLLTAIAGVLMVLDNYLSIPAIHTSAAEIRAWAPIMTSFAVITGTFNLISVHAKTVGNQETDRYYSAIFLLFMVVTVAVGLSQGTTAPAYDFLYNKMLVPCSSTMAGMTAFFIASASYRAFRASNVDSAFLLVAAFLVMLGRVPIGEVISEHMPVVAQWLMDIPNLAGQRAFLVCSGIGFMSLCLRTIVGLHRAHIGGSE